MSFINVRLPTQVEINAVRREREPVEIVTTDAKFEVRNVRHAQGLFEYDISFPTQDYDGTIIAAVKDMFKASRGGLYAFRFRDWDPENHLLSDEVIGTGTGALTTFQITKTWTVGGQSQVRNITRPVSALTVKVNSVTQVSGYSIDYATGILTFSVAPANGLSVSVSGTYDIPVRFDLTFQATGLASVLEHIDTLTLLEVKE
jgi:uncharacterized protein (TIGR02217 family)